MQPGLDKSLLGRVFRDLRVTAHTIDHAPDTLDMDANQFAKCVSVAILGSGDELRLVIANRCDRHHSDFSLSVIACMFLSIIRKSPRFYSEPIHLI